jgi:protein-tyrosine phosphatase
MLRAQTTAYRERSDGGDRTIAKTQEPGRTWHNARDLGGTRLGAGRRLRHGLLYRAGVCQSLQPPTSPPNVTPNTIFDLRSSGEREARPTPWRQMGVRRYWCSHEAESSADLRRVIFAGGSSAADVRANMLALYADLPFTQHEAYRCVVHALAARHVPLLFHCAAGKDRTGVLAALILAYLGASDGDIIADYLLSNDAPDHFEANRTETAAAMAGAHELIPSELRGPLLTADPECLEAMFAKLNMECGGVLDYFRDILGVSFETRTAIEAVLTEPVQPDGQYDIDYPSNNL